MNDESYDSVVRLLEESGDLAPSTEMLLDEVAAFLTQYVKFTSDAQVVAGALWVLHTHAIEAAETTPYLSISSPERRSGKSRLLEVLNLIVRESLMTMNITEAVLFRSIDKYHPTLLCDETDTVFGPKAGPREGLRGIFNGGHRRGAVALRIVGEGTSMEPKKFDVFGAKALSGIGALPDTVADRSIPIKLQRKRAGDAEVAKFRERKVRPLGEALKFKLEAWATPERIERLAEVEPDVPDELNDRAADGWEPLIAIADDAGATWALRARAAAVQLSTETVSEESVGLLLIGHVREAFGAVTDKLSTRDLLGSLVSRDDGPWAEWWGKGVKDGETNGPAARLARLLKPFGIKSKTVRTGETVFKGFERSDFEETWENYLEPVTTPDPPSEPQSGYTVTSQVGAPIGSELNGLKQAPDQECNDVTTLGSKQWAPNTKQSDSSANGSAPGAEATRSRALTCPECGRLGGHHWTRCSSNGAQA